MASQVVDWSTAAELQQLHFKVQLPPCACCIPLPIDVADCDD